MAVGVPANEQPTPLPELLERNIQLVVKARCLSLLFI